MKKQQLITIFQVAMTGILLLAAFANPGATFSGKSEATNQKVSQPKFFLKEKIFDENIFIFF